jgi:hypothetical protein
MLLIKINQTGKTKLPIKTEGMNSKAVIAFGSLELIFCLFSGFSAASAVKKKSKEGSKK